MNYYNNIVKLNLKKYKKSYISLFIVIILACIFTLSITIFNDSLLKTEEQQRKDIYGGWHISVCNSDATLYRDLVNHGTIKSIGKMTGYGYVLGTDKNAVGLIGSAEDNMVNMGLSLMDGNFPKKDNEIAVEMSYLSMLGYSYELGQTIQLEIQSFNEENKEYGEIEKTYILTGVIKNYSSIWKTDGNQLVSFFVTDTSLKVSPVFENIFVTLKKEYAKNADELALLAANRGNFIKNDYTYYEYTSNNKVWYEAYLTGIILALIVTIISAFFIFNIYYASFKEHNKSFIIMRCLGASKHQISILYFKELIMVLSTAFVAGIITGYLVSFIGYKIIRYYVTDNFVFYLDIVKLASLMLIIVFFVLLFSMFAVFRIGKVPMTGNIKLQLESRIYYQRARKLKPLTIRHMVKIFNSAHRKDSVVYFLLSLGSFLVFAGTSYNAYQKFMEYYSINNVYTQDYDYGIMSSYSEPKSHIEEEEVDKIKNIYGIDYVRAYRSSNYIPVVWNGMEKSKYAEYLKNDFFLKYAGDNAVYTTIYSLSDEAKDYKFYIDEIDEGNLSLNKFLRKDEVIIYLPVIYKAQDEKMLSNVDKIYGTYETAYDEMTENTIEIGDELIVIGEKGNVTVKVSGIIFNFNNKSSQSYLRRPYSIICNKSLYDRLVPNHKTYEYLQIYTNINANYERTDVEISKISDGFFINNLRIQKEEAKYNALVNAVISFVISLIIIFIIATVQYNSQLAKMESENWRNHILSVLGMDKCKIQFIYLYNILKNSIFSIVIGFFVIFICQLILYINKFILESKGFYNLCKYVFTVYFTELSWFYIFIFIIAYLTINILVVFYPLKKYQNLKD